MQAESRLKELAITLPPAPTPLGGYVPVKSIGQFVFLSGMLPLEDGQVVFRGASDKESGRLAARLATLNALSVLRNAIGSLDRIRQVVKAGVFVQAAPGFEEHAFIADGCSELLNQLFLETGRHVRVAVGVSSLPRNASVEIELVFELSDEAQHASERTTECRNLSSYPG